MLSFLCAFKASAQNQPGFESNSPWETNVGVITLNIATNADQAWRLIEGVRPASAQPGKRPEVERNAMGADMCREFIKRYPNDSKVSLANKLRRDYLMRTIELGNTNRIGEFENLFPKKDTELARMRAYRVFALGPSAVREEWEKNLRLLKPLTGDVEFEFFKLAEQSEPETARRLAEELIKVSPMKSIKDRSAKLLKKYEPIGQPIHLKATMVDGQQLDLEQWKGKVVLLHFWTPTSPRNSIPDEDLTLPAAKTAYEKLHARGLEVLGINLARDQKQLRSPMADGKITWPQYWASTNLSAELRAVAGMAPGQIGLGYPCFALVDKNGTVCDLAVPRAELVERIEKLLK